jgi:hypothetical protein
VDDRVKERDTHAGICRCKKSKSPCEAELRTLHRVVEVFFAALESSVVFAGAFEAVPLDAGALSAVEAGLGAITMDNEGQR